LILSKENLTLGQLAMAVYLLRHLLDTKFEAPPLISLQMLYELNKLVNEGLLEIHDNVVKLSMEGLRKTYSILRLFKESTYVVPSRNLLIECKLFLDELERAVNIVKSVSLSRLFIIQIEELLRDCPGRVIEYARKIVCEIVRS